MAGRREELLRGIDPAWHALADAGLLDAALSAADGLGGAAPPDLIFEAFRYGAPADIAVVIMGQGPLPVAAPKGTPPSPLLERMFRCLEHAGLRPGGATSSDLRPWAAQGVLLLSSAHAAGWKPFIDELLRRLCADRAAAGTQLHFLLWGGGAHAHALIARHSGHVVHEWAHPESAGASAAGLGEQFREINAALIAAKKRPINWNNEAACIAFSDGSCSLNGKPGARASFAALLTGAQFGAAVIRGEVCPAEYAFIDEQRPALGIRATKVRAPPSNNRGELLGVIYALLALLRGCAVGRVELISDSEICVKTLLEWLPARLKKGTERELKNYDLVAIAWRLLGLLREQAASVAITHMRSHQKPPPESAPRRERFIHRGNALADEHAALALKNGRPYSVEVLNAPAVLRPLTGGAAEAGRRNEPGNVLEAARRASSSC
jgi:uracil DNA glycosylase/ribonuclease HI